MQIDKIVEVVAERNYKNVDGGSVIVRMGKPALFPEGEGIDGFFYCPFQITGLGDDRIMHSSGFDAVQAIFGALRMIGARIYSSKLVSQGKLKWDGELDEDLLGFPKKF